MARHCRKAYGIDIHDVSENVVPPALADRLEFRRVRGEGTGFPDAMFDVILMSEVVPMIPEPREFFSEVSRILKPGGRIVLVNPLERRGIRKEYERQGWLVRGLRALGRAPADYESYTERLQATFGTAWKKPPDEAYYHRVLAEFGFAVTRTVFTPSAAAQEAYERLQFVFLCFGLPTFGPSHFLFYPAFKLRDVVRRDPRGTGCVMVARRTGAPATGDRSA
jgi:ubiquinone/menaquinone biosynthesis C-methylase UbiE